MKKIFLAIYVFFIPYIAYSQKSHPISVEIKSDKEQYKVGEAINLSIIMKHIGTDTIKVYQPGIMLRSVDLYLAFNEKPVIYSMRWTAVGASIISLIPEQVLSINQDITYKPFSIFTKPGTYYLEVGYQYKPYKEREHWYISHDYPEASNIKSNKIKFTILPISTEEAIAYKAYKKVLSAGEPSIIVTFCKAFLEQHSPSIFEPRVRLELSRNLKNEKKYEEASEQYNIIWESNQATPWQKENALWGLANMYYKKLHNLEKAIKTIQLLNTPGAISMAKTWKHELKKLNSSN